MSTDLTVERHHRQPFGPIDQWFWPTSDLLRPGMSETKAESVNSCGLTTNITSTSVALQRRHKHWWKVCWIYSNGNFMCQRVSHQSKQSSDYRHFHQQIQQNSSFSMCSSQGRALYSDRCVNRDDQLFSTAKSNSTTTANSANSQHEMPISSDFPPHPEPRHQDVLRGPPELGLPPMPMSTSCSPQVSSSATSGFLQQRLTQPLSALLRQKSEHKNSIIQFFIQFKGADWRADQLQYQTPAHDVQMLKQQSNEVKFVRNQQRKAQIKPQLFLNKALNYCFKCKNTIETDSYGVKISVAKNGQQNNGYSIATDDEDSSALRLSASDTTPPALNGSTALYHIECFTCEECLQVLVDLKAFLYTASDGTDRSKVTSALYCSRHFVELYKPRCRFCDHLIFDEECTEAEGKAWHLGHFCCTECKRSLGGQQYIMANPSKQSDKKSIYENKSEALPQSRQKEQQLPYCLTCFDILFGELCEECGELIGCDVGAITHEGRSWHARDVCFKCNQCSKALLGKPFLPAFDGRIYCSIICSQEAIQGSRYRERRRHRPVPHSHANSGNTNNDLSKKSEKCETDSQTNGQITRQTKPKLQMRANHQIYSQSTAEDRQRPPVRRELSNGVPTNGLPISGYQYNNDVNNDFEKKFSEIQLNNGMECHYESERPQRNDCVLSIDDHKCPQNIVNTDQNLNNDLMNRQMIDYISKYQPINAVPNYVLEYMKQRFLQSEANGQNSIIGASIEYGSSISEDERLNQQTVDLKTQPYKDINYNQMTPMTSSTSSSLNTTPFEANPAITSPLKFNPSIAYSSSSAETTPLLLRSLEERAKQLTQMSNQTKHLLNKSQILSDRSLPKSESPSQTSQADQSSNSSYVENNNQTNHSNHHLKAIPDLKPCAEVGADSPSTQSTALQSTSSQTTPETNPRSTLKSVTFDPSVKETTGRRANRKSKARPSKRSEWSDSHSCSTCSTCSSSSSSSDENFDYESTLDRNRSQWLGGTKIHYVANDRKKSASAFGPQTTPPGHHNESCTIS